MPRENNLHLAIWPVSATVSPGTDSPLPDDRYHFHRDYMVFFWLDTRQNIMIDIHLFLVCRYNMIDFANRTPVTGALFFTAGRQPL